MAPSYCPKAKPPIPMQQDVTFAMEALFAYTKDCVCYLDKGRRMLRVNRALQKVLGDNFRENGTQRLDEFIPEQELGTFLQVWQEALQTGEAQEFKTQLHNRAGAWEPFECTLLYKQEDEQALLISRPLPKPDRVLLAQTSAGDQDVVQVMATEIAQLTDELKHLYYVVSHDLTGPLRIMVSYAQISQELLKTGDQARMAENLGMIIGSGKVVSEMVKAILELSRLQRYVLRPEWLNLDRLIQEKYESIKYRYPNVLVKLTVGPMPQVWMDKRYLMRMLEELLDNALKFSQDEPIVQIELSTEFTDEGCTWYISDNGVGFNGQFQNRVFQMFQRLHPRQDFEGIGAGLALVKEIVQKHGGRITAESSPHAGATFGIWLPAYRVERPE